MWTTRSESLSARTTKLGFAQNGRPLRVSEVLELWQTSDEFRARFIDELATSPFEAYRWETPVLTKRTLDREFECVLVDSPGLAHAPEPDAFAEHFQRAVDGISVFSNLSGSATLIVPCPAAAPDAYNHLGRFLRSAPMSQRHALWRRVGQEVAARVSDTPLWLSTAGAGVYWLHVRIDVQPKYYAHAPYKANR